MKKTSKNLENFYQAYNAKILEQKKRGSAFRRRAVFFLFIALAAVIIFIIFACVKYAFPNQAADSVERKLTITGLDGHDGLYVVALGLGTNQKAVYAADDICTNSKMVFVGSEIAGNRVELNIWHKFDETMVNEYSGSGPLHFFAFVINKHTFTKAEELSVEDYLNKGKAKPWWFVTAGEVKGVSLPNGEFEGLFEEILPYYQNEA